jgi:two-component system sensor histidine kinase KdpD
MAGIAQTPLAAGVRSLAAGVRSLAARLTSLAAGVPLPAGGPPVRIRMWAMDPVRLRATLRAAAIVGGLLLATTLLIAFLEGPMEVHNAAMTYLLAVIGSAALLGWTAAAATAVGAFLIYDLLFIEPRFTLTVADPREWLTLLLLLVVGMVVAWLTGALRERAETATAREREAHALYQISRVLATRTDTRSALPELESILARETRSRRAWITISPGAGKDKRAKDAVLLDGRIPFSQGALRRRADDGRPEWVRLHQSAMLRRADTDTVAWKVPIEASRRVIGSVWVERPRAAGQPDVAATQLLSAAADQMGQAIEQDRLLVEARDAEIARQGDALKSALLDSVSHDLRTPLASIRAAAGTLLDPDMDLSTEDRIASATAIDREADNLARLVANLLDLSRIEGGALATDQEIYELDDLLERSLDRLRPRLAGRPVTVTVPPDLPPARVDAVLFDQVLTNLLENAAKYAPADAPIVVRAAMAGPMVRVTVEDGGPGVPRAALPRLFDKFYRVQQRSDGSRPGTGIGLAVVRGLTEAMGGTVGARRSELGGLAVDIDLPSAPPLELEPVALADVASA